LVNQVQKALVGSVSFLAIDVTAYNIYAQISDMEYFSVETSLICSDMPTFFSSGAMPLIRGPKHILISKWGMNHLSLTFGKRLLKLAATWQQLCSVVGDLTIHFVGYAGGPVVILANEIGLGKTVPNTALNYGDFVYYVGMAEENVATFIQFVWSFFCITCYIIVLILHVATHIPSCTQNYDISIYFY
ncbi:hypothetical protein ACJX0J_015432, partial [Zea mays]